MCTYCYLHHHHVPPCTRAPDIVVHWDFCPNAVKNPSRSSNGTKTLPCGQNHFDFVGSIDADNPCASGGCLVSPTCSSGTCRLEALGGRWRCCVCERGGNGLTWCGHKMRASPDTFCYHRVCERCTTDR